jgi:hypothetical protein
MLPLMDAGNYAGLTGFILGMALAILIAILAHSDRRGR